MSILLNDNLSVQAPLPVDNRFGPYATTTAANAAIPLANRYIGLTVGIGTTTTVDYWYNGGTADGNLIAKTSGGSGTVTSVAALTLGTTGTDVSSTVANGTTTPVITLNLPTSSSLNRGLLSSTDWTTFNNKGSGTVTSASVVSANGFSGSVATPTTTPAITISTSVTGLLKGNGTGVSAATVGADYSVGTSSLATGILKSTTTTGALSIAVAGDFPTLNQNTTGTAANVTGTVSISNGGTGQTAKADAFNALSPITTAGDLIIGNGTNTATRLPIGANTYVLTSNGTTATWAASGGGGGGTGTVTSVTGAGSVSGLTLTGTVTTAGNLTLGGAITGFATSGANTNLTSVALTTGTISTAPVNNTDIVNKAYADAIASGIHFHEAVDLATTAALPANTYNNGTSGVGATLTATANGALSVDSTLTVVANRILVKNQANGAHNGVYVVTQVGSAGAPYILTRSTDFDSVGTGVDQIDEGDFFLVTSGVANVNTAWVQQTAPPITIGTTAIVFQQFSAPITYTAGTGLSESPSYTFNIANTGTAGTYGSASSVPVFVTNAQGQVTSATNTAIAINGSAVTGNIAGNAANVTGTVAIANGGTGATSQQTAINALAGSVTSGQYLRGNATNVVMSAIQVADVPTLNQNTTGTAANVTGTVAVANGGTGSTTYTDGQLLIGNSSGNTLTKATLTQGTGVTITNGNGSITISATGSGGTVTSVTGTSPVVSSGGATPAISLATNYGDTLNPYASKTANFFLAAPSGAAGAPTFRAIVAADIPTLNQNTTGTASNVTGTVAIANGGTGATTRQNAMDALAGAVTSGQYLRGDGTDVVMSAIQVADVPTLNQNTTGNAANVTGTVAITNGGTGATSKVAAFDALSPTTTKGDLIVSDGTDNIRLGVGTNTYVLTADSLEPSGLKWSPAGGGGGSGTVTSVGWTGGIVSVGTPTTTPAFTIAGTSGGIPYFSSGTTWASSGVLAANALVVGGGAATAPATITTGTGVVTALGINTGTAGSFVVNGGALGTPSGGTVTNLTGTASININGTVGATTATTGAFTTISASGAITSTVASGTAPFTVSSTTRVLNLFATQSLNLNGGVVGSLPYQSGTNTTSLLAPNTTTDKRMLTMTGTGAAGAAPVWDSGITLPATGTLATLAGAETLTNKRVTPRVSPLSSNSSTYAINTDSFDMVVITNQTVTITSITTTGTPTNGQKLWLSITGTAAVGFTLSSSNFESSTVTLPTTTVSTNRLDIGFVWNPATSKWRCVAQA